GLAAGPRLVGGDIGFFVILSLGLLGFVGSSGFYIKERISNSTQQNQQNQVIKPIALNPLSGGVHGIVVNNQNNLGTPVSTASSNHLGQLIPEQKENEFLGQIVAERRKS